MVGSSPAAGEGAYYRELVAEADVVIAADGGVSLCREAGRVPDLCVGDFDSAATDDLCWAERAGAEVLRYAENKDESDLDLAVAAARRLGCSGITLTAAFSGRMDHTLASLGTLLAAADLGAVADEPGWTAYPLRAGVASSVTLEAAEGTLVSVIAFGADTRVSVSGMEYPLSSAVLAPLSSLGVSNVVCGRSPQVELTSGSAVVIVQRTG